MTTPVRMEFRFSKTTVDSPVGLTLRMEERGAPVYVLSLESGGIAASAGVLQGDVVKEIGASTGFPMTPVTGATMGAQLLKVATGEIVFVIERGTKLVDPKGKKDGVPRPLPPSPEVEYGDNVDILGGGVSNDAPPPADIDEMYV